MTCKKLVGRAYTAPSRRLHHPPESLMKRILVGKKDHSKYLFSAEEYYTEMIIEEKLPPMNMIFLFFSRPQQSQQLIEKYVEDVSPSWIKKLYETREKIKKKSVFQERQLKKSLVKSGRATGDLILSIGC